MTWGLVPSLVALRCTCSSSLKSWAMYGPTACIQNSRWGLTYVLNSGLKFSLFMLMNAFFSLLSAAIPLTDAWWQCRVGFSVSSTITPRSLSCVVFKSRVVCPSWVSVYVEAGLFRPQCITLHFPVLNFSSQESVHLASVSRSVWRASTSWLSRIALYIFVSSANSLILLLTNEGSSFT